MRITYVIKKVVSVLRQFLSQWLYKHVLFTFLIDNVRQMPYTSFI